MSQAGRGGSGVRALVLGRSLLNGGAEKQSIFLTRALADLGTAELVCLYDEADEQMQGVAREQGIQPTFLHGSLPRKVWWLVRHIRRRRVDLVVATLPVTNLAAGIVGLLCGCDVMGGFRNSWEPRALRLWGARVLHTLVFRGTIANSEAGRDFLVAKGFSSDNILTVPNAIEPARCEERGVRPTGVPIRVITVARMVPQKDYPLALRVFARVRQAASAGGRTVRYDIVGYGPESDRIASLSDELGISASVRFLGRDSDILGLLTEADIYLSTSRHEGIPNSMMEAMSAGLPVVATPAGDVPVLARDGTTGFISPGWDPADLAALVLRLVRDDDLRRRMGAAARRRIEQEYSVEKLRIRLSAALSASDLRSYRALSRSPP